MGRRHAQHSRTCGLRSVITAIRRQFSFDAGFEHAIELDPRHVTPALAEALVELGITRASLGVQDVNPLVQAAIGRLQPLVEGTARPLERLEAHGAGDVGHRAQALRVEEGERAGPGHELRPVDQRQPLLRLQANRREPGSVQRRRARETTAVDERLALTDERKREMGQRSQVASAGRMRSPITA